MSRITADEWRAEHDKLADYLDDVVFPELNGLRGAVADLLDYISDTEKGSVTFEELRERFAQWDTQKRVFCTCMLPGVAIDNDCPKHGDSNDRS